MDLTVSSFSTTAKGLQTIFKSNGRRLKSLKLCKFFYAIEKGEPGSIDCASVISTIPVKLPNLENLSIDDILTVKLIRALPALSHLKCLNLNCVTKSINTLLKTLSDRTIEELQLHNYVVADEDNSTPPLIFSKLKSLVSSKYVNVQFLRLVTKSQMPMITNLHMGSSSKIIKDHEILSLLNSKKSLKSFQIECCEEKESRIALLYGIVKILETEPDRPFLKLNIGSLKMLDEEVNITRTA